MEMTVRNFQAIPFQNTTIFVVRPPHHSNTQQQVKAATVEVHGKHLGFLTDKGKLAGVFLLDLVESWNEIAPRSRRHEARTFDLSERCITPVGKLECPECHAVFLAQKGQPIEDKKRPQREPGSVPE
jgi:hypothetical protein